MTALSQWTITFSPCYLHNLQFLLLPLKFISHVSFSKPLARVVVEPYIEKKYPVTVLVRNVKHLFGHIWKNFWLSSFSFHNVKVSKRISTEKMIYKIPVNIFDMHYCVLFRKGALWKNMKPSLLNLLLLPPERWNEVKTNSLNFGDNTKRMKTLNDKHCKSQQLDINA